ncbi:polygalacturonase-like [Macadamia integrifolia]|uniref:polygalacturonase-like n=1 Tax=Macadamia integrifolia TaxID=60698 RepID=UPI001C4FA3B1|nr:polygalacturonase-like [Macadamia integrifolia]
MEMKKPMNFLLFLLFLFFSPSTGSSIYNVVSLGARPNIRTDSAHAFLQAWAMACGSANPATIYVPPGQYYLGQAHFVGNCRNTDITIQIDGTLVAPANYRVVGNAGSWIMFEGVVGVSIYGGTIDGQGSGFWACKASGNTCPDGATNLGFTNSKNIVINGLKSLNSQMFHIVIDRCENVNIQKVMVMAPGNSPNTDGIHVEMSTDVTISGANIRTGDDCISIGPGTSNLWIESIACGPGHGISIGSLGWNLKEPGVQNVTVKTVTFSGSQNGFRIKSWARPSYGFVKGVLFQDGIMENVNNPIIIDQNYCPHGEDCPGQVSGVKISEVTYKNIHGTSATEVAMKFDCSSQNPCSGIELEDVNLTYQNQIATSSCTNAVGYAHGLIQPSSCLK